MSRRLVLLPCLVLIGLLVLASGALAQSTLPQYSVAPAKQKAASAPKPAKAKLKVTLEGLRHHQLKVGDRLSAIGRISPYVPRQNVKLRVVRNGHAVKERTFHVTEIGHSGVGRFHVKTQKLIAPGPYHVVALHRQTANQAPARRVSKAVGVSYPNLNQGDSGNSVRLFTDLLAARGYYVRHTASYDDRVGLAVLAFRKVNGMARTTNATPGIFRTLARGKGGFKLKYPNAGKHVEVDISRQVMALADHGKALHIFHVSTGAPATPTITGHYQVYSKTPGRLPDGMYYSSFWHGGYAIHGYPSVPTYNASHGCVRVPEVFAIWIYNWLPIGTDVYTYQ